MGDVEAVLAWAYQEQRVTWVEARAGGVGGGGDPYSACRVDGGGRASCQLHPDAEAIHDAVLRLPDWRMRLVIAHSKAGTRPQVYAGNRPRCEPVIVGQFRDGRPRIEIEYDKRRHPIWCAVRYRGFDEDYAGDRRDYREWRLGLMELLPALARLATWRVTGPAAPERPWG
ncbi:hypothetical protein [Allostella humosa]|uniref:hypothetical protein n=1 Tax=Stella humosa TaxID=94 RepID=UPI000F4D0F91|nr:hypothetical protein [Stella humosa]